MKHEDAAAVAESFPEMTFWPITAGYNPTVEPRLDMWLPMGAIMSVR